MSLRPRNYPLGARERVGRVWLRESALAVSGCVGMRVKDGTGCAGPGIIRRGSRRVLNGVCRFGPGIIRRGRESASAMSGCGGPGIIRRERRSISNGADCVDPGIVRRGMGVVGKLTITVDMLSVLAPLMIDNVIVNYEYHGDIHLGTLKRVIGICTLRV